MRAEASRATILQAGPLVRVQQGEPRRSKVRFAPILFFRKKTKPSARCLAPPRFAKNARRFFAREAARPTTLRFRGGPEADRRRWRKKGGEGRLAKGRNASGSEQCDHFASWTKVGKSEQMESRPPPVAEEGRRRALSKREKCERERAVRPFCKPDRWFE